MTIFSNQKVSNVSARQIQKDIEWAQKEYNRGNETPLFALRSAHIGNESVEAFVKQVVKEKSDSDYRAWYQDVSEYAGCAGAMDLSWGAK